MPRLFFEDFTPGSVSTYGGRQVSRDEIVAFAREFDAQPFHVDEDAARDTFVGRLIASGWHSCALLMRMIADGFLLDAASLGAPGIEETKWLRPVFPRDTLWVRHTVLETKPSRSRPEMGLVRFRFEVLNQADERVLEQTNWIMIGRRSPAPAPPERDPAGGGGENARDRADPAETRTASGISGTPGPAFPFFEDVRVGSTSELGTYAFTAERIVAFAREFDPQAFHLDETAARNGPFGALSASGWHTAAGWMHCMVGHQDRLAAAAAAQGERTARIGSSPGFRDLRWLRPVLAGDTVRYFSTIMDKRPSASRPGWGLVFHRNTGLDQNGREVFRFDGCVFWERDPERAGAPAAG